MPKKVKIIRGGRELNNDMDYLLNDLYAPFNRIAEFFKNAGAYIKRKFRGGKKKKTIQRKTKKIRRN